MSARKEPPLAGMSAAHRKYLIAAMTNVEKAIAKLGRVKLPRGHSKKLQPVHMPLHDAMDFLEAIAREATA